MLNIYFFEKKSAFYEIIRKNVLEPGRPQMTAWRKRISCWITKATITVSECVLCRPFPLQKYLHESA